MPAVTSIDNTNTNTTSSNTTSGETKPVKTDKNETKEMKLVKPKAHVYSPEDGFTYHASLLSQVYYCLQRQLRVTLRKQGRSAGCTSLAPG